MPKKKDKKQSSRFFKVYAIVCSVSLIIGLFSFFAAKKVAMQVTDLQRPQITIPSYEKLLQPPVKSEEENNKTDAQSKTEEQTSYAVSAKIQPEAEINQTPEPKEEETFVLPCQGTLLKIFSDKKPLKSKTMGDFRTHNGVDIKCSVGDSVYAALSGTVEKVYEDSLLGVTVVIAHGDSLKTQYSNIAGKSMVKEGQSVKINECIGCVGDTAKSELLDDAHLHFSVIKDDKYVNPEDYIKILKPEETV